MQAPIRHPRLPIGLGASDGLNRLMQISARAAEGPLLPYLERLRVREESNLRATGLAAVVRGLVPAALRPRLKSRLTHLAMPRTTRQAKRMLASGQAIKLHLGCGEISRDGWANVDLVGAGAADFIWDLREPLPFPAGSVSAIFHEHLLEHLTYWQGVSLFRECRRLLRPGGILRLGVPDFGRYARDYADGGNFISRVRPGAPTRLMALAEVAYCYQHVSMWDADTLVSLFKETGFTNPEVRRSGDSRLGTAPDTDYREPETVYVEGIG